MAGVQSSLRLVRLPSFRAVTAVATGRFHPLLKIQIKGQRRAKEKSRISSALAD